jgi:dimethylargininase
MRRMTIAITRPVSPSIARCELTHLAREPIDVARAREQHGAYERCLRDLGCEVVTLPSAPELPDAVFVEDVAIVLEDVAVLTRPGAESRRAETDSVARGLAPYRRLVHLEPPATLDGGDVLRVGDTLHVGRSSRTNEAGLAALAAVVAPHGLRVAPVAVRGCLHLKSAVTLIAPGLLLIQPAWVDAAVFGHALEVVAVDPDEPFAANALRVGDGVIHAAAFPRTRARLEARGLDVRPGDVSELAKAEGAVTCCSLVFEG